MCGSRMTRVWFTYSSHPSHSSDFVTPRYVSGWNNIYVGKETNTIFGENCVVLKLRNATFSERIDIITRVLLILVVLLVIELFQSEVCF